MSWHSLLLHFVIFFAALSLPVSAIAGDSQPLPSELEKQLRVAIESGKVEEAVALADKLGREKGMPIVQEYARTLKEPVARYAFYILQQRESNATIPFYNDSEYI